MMRKTLVMLKKYHWPYRIFVCVFVLIFVVMAFTDMRDWIKVVIIALLAGIDVYFITKVESKNQQIIAVLTDGALF